MPDTAFPLDAATLLARAEAAMGAPDAEHDRIAPNLAALLESVHLEARLSQTGRELTSELIETLLCHRISAQDWVRRHPEVLDEKIEAPVFLTGLPRSGTTYFQYLFDRDTRFRLIRTWEANNPAPPPSTDPASVQARIEAQVEIDQRRTGIVENFAAMHLSDPTGSDECHMFLSQSFGAVGFHNFLNVPSFFDHVMDRADLVTTYEIHKRQLQLLQWNTQPKKRWALKYPNHTMAMDALLAVYPDARLVMTHRDPVQVLGSISNLTHALRDPRMEGNDPHEVGRQMFDFIARHIDRVLDFAAGPDADKVIHVDYYRLLDDPMAEMEQVHAALGIDTPDEVRAAVTSWRAENPKGKRGANPYALEKFGLDRDEVEERFRPYRERFGVPHEAEALAALAAGAGA